MSSLKRVAFRALICDVTKEQWHVCVGLLCVCIFEACCFLFVCFCVRVYVRAFFFFFSNHIFCRFLFVCFHVYVRSCLHAVLSVHIRFAEDLGSRLYECVS